MKRWRWRTLIFTSNLTLKRCNVLSSAGLKKIDKIQKVASTFSPLTSFCGHYIRCASTFILPCVWRDACCHMWNSTLLTQLWALFWELKKLGLIQVIHSIEKRNRAVQHCIPQDYQDLFSGLGCLPGTYSIKADENIQPVIQRPGKILIPLRDKAKDELDRMECEGVIVKPREPTR